MHTVLGLMVVWSREQFCALLDAITNTKLCALLAPYSGARLRCLEALDLKNIDIEASG